MYSYGPPMEMLPPQGGRQLRLKTMPPKSEEDTLNGI